MFGLARRKILYMDAENANKINFDNNSYIGQKLYPNLREKNKKITSKTDKEKINKKSKKMKKAFSIDESDFSEYEKLYKNRVNINKNYKTSIFTLYYLNINKMFKKLFKRFFNCFLYNKNPTR